MPTRPEDPSQVLLSIGGLVGREVNLDDFLQTLVDRVATTMQAAPSRKPGARNSPTSSISDASFSWAWTMCSERAIACQSIPPTAVTVSLRFSD